LFSPFGSAELAASPALPNISHDGQAAQRLSVVWRDNRAARDQYSFNSTSFPIVTDPTAGRVLERRA
jgi:hypothetical protein